MDSIPQYSSLGGCEIFSNGIRRIHLIRTKRMQYIECIVVDIHPFFVPLEVVIQNEGLPSLIGIAAWEIDRSYCDLPSWGVKKR